ncbi:MAG: helix-turn-helix domain-containing protein [Gammaproteobacteria bacterium]
MKNAQPVAELSAPRSKAERITDTNRRAQQRRIAAFLLEHGSATTIQLRELCNAMHPAGRIKELRRSGWSIATVWTLEHDAQGRAHRCARYVLQRPGGAA